MKYSRLTKIRDEEVDGIKDWLWIKADQGAWSGPKNDWEKAHKTKYFKYLRARNVVVTAGANQGMYVRFFAPIFRAVYAFEPDPLCFYCLVNNVQEDNVVKIQGALGVDNGFVVMNHCSLQNVGMNTVSPGVDAYIPIFKLDSFKFEQLDLLQLDIEGYEIHALNGAVETINRLKPIIILENGRSTEIQNFMERVGYDFVEQTSADSIWKPKKV